MATRVTRSRRQLPQQLEQPRARWNEGVTKIFVDLVIDQVQRGNRLNNSFSKKAWKVMCKEFYRQTSLKWDMEELKSQYEVLRKQYAIVNSLVDQHDFSLNESTGVITGSDAAWAEYIKVHPDAQPIRNNGCPIYPQLCVIFSGLGTNGRHDLSGEPGGRSNPSVPKSVHMNNALEASSSESEEVDDMAENQDTAQPAPHNATPSHKRGRKGIDDAIAGAIMQMAAASKLRTAAIRQINSRYTIADCIKKLDELQGVEEEVYFAALELFKNPNAREIFLSLKDEKRLIWLRGKCTSPAVT